MNRRGISGRRPLHQQDSTEGEHKLLHAPSVLSKWSPSVRNARLSKKDLNVSSGIQKGMGDFVKIDVADESKEPAALDMESVSLQRFPSQENLAVSPTVQSNLSSVGYMLDYIRQEAKESSEYVQSTASQADVAHAAEESPMDNDPSKKRAPFHQMLAGGYRGNRPIAFDMSKGCRRGVSQKSSDTSVNSMTETQTAENGVEDWDNEIQNYSDRPTEMSDLYSTSHDVQPSLHGAPPLIATARIATLDTSPVSYDAQTPHTSSTSVSGMPMPIDSTSAAAVGQAQPSVTSAVGDVPGSTSKHPNDVSPDQSPNKILDTTKGCRRGARETVPVCLKEVLSPRQYMQTAVASTRSSTEMDLNPTQVQRATGTYSNSPGSYPGKAQAILGDYSGVASSVSTHYPGFVSDPVSASNAAVLAPGRYIGCDLQDSASYYDNVPNSAFNTQEHTGFIPGIATNTTPFFSAYSRENESQRHSNCYEKDTLAGGSNLKENQWAPYQINHPTKTVHNQYKQQFNAQNISNNTTEVNFQQQQAQNSAQLSPSLQNWIHRLSANDGQLSLSQDALRNNPNFHPVPVAPVVQFGNQRHIRGPHPAVTAQNYDVTLSNLNEGIGPLPNRAMIYSNPRQLTGPVSAQLGQTKGIGHVTFNTAAQFCDPSTQPVPSHRNTANRSPALIGMAHSNAPPRPDVILDLSKPPPILNTHQLDMSKPPPDLSKPPPNMNALPTDFGRSALRTSESPKPVEVNRLSFALPISIPDVNKPPPDSNNPLTSTEFLLEDAESMLNVILSGPTALPTEHQSNTFDSLANISKEFQVPACSVKNVSTELQGPAFSSIASLNSLVTVTSQTLPVTMAANAPNGECTNKPPETPVSILKRPSPKQTNPKDLNSLLQHAPMFTNPSDAKETDVTWRKLKTENIGQFFVNKVFLSEDRTRVWTPPHLGNKHTVCQEFEEVVITRDLQEVLVIDTCHFLELVPYLLKFPTDTRVTVVCPTIPGYCLWAPRQRTEKTICVCQNYLEHTIESGDFGCNPETCVNVKVVDVLEGLYDSDINCRLLVLRYTETIRVVMFSGSLNKVSWEKVQQFGWYCDMPIIPQQSVAAQFGNDLINIVAHACDNRTAILRDAHFGGLSKHIHLITSIPGDHPERHNEFAHRKVMSLRPLCTGMDKVVQNFCQTTKFGRGKAAIMLERLVELRPPLNSRRSPLKMLYPSSDYVKRCIENIEGLTLQDVDAMFENRDSSLCTPYLHDPVGDVPVIPHSNIYLSIQSMQEHDVTRSYGYLITGSQGISYGSWGDKGESHTHQYKCSRYELGIGVYPYTDGHVHYAIDLEEIGLPWAESDVEAYRGPAFTPRYTHKPTLQSATYIGVVKRYHFQNGIKQVAFVTPLPGHHPLVAKFAPFPDVEAAYIHEDCLHVYGAKMPDVGVVIEFKGFMRALHNRRRGKQHGLRADAIVNMYNTLSDAMEFYNIEYTPDEKDYGLRSEDSREDLPIYLGVLKRHLGAQTAFIDALPFGHSLAHKYPEFPERASAFLHQDIISAFTRTDEMLEVGCVIEFRGGLANKYHRLKKNEKVKFRAYSIIQIHASIEAAEMFYSGDKSEFKRQAPPVRKLTLWPDMTPAQQMQCEGIITDEDFDNYWKARRPKLPENPEKARRLESVNTKPKYIESDMEWLEKYATRKAFGRLPKTLMGPLNIHAMQIYVQEHRRRFLQERTQDKTGIE